MRKILYGNSYNGHIMSTSDKRNEGYYEEILDKIDSLLGDMIRRHEKVLFTTFGVNYPANSAGQYPEDNSLISRFMEALALHCKRRGYDPKYLWARESSSTDQTHYHVMLLLNADITQNAHGIFNKATDLWQGCLGIEDAGGLIHWRNDDRYGGVKIRRNASDFTEVFDHCFQRAGYGAKCFSKGDSPAYVNEYGCSRLP